MSESDGGITELPVSERPATSGMSVEQLRDEYKMFDIVALNSDKERWERALDVWTELESRDLVEFPECSRGGCESRQWRFEVGGPAHCAECGTQVHDVEQSEAIQDAVHRLIHGGESA